MLLYFYKKLKRCDYMISVTTEVQSITHNTKQFEKKNIVYIFYWINYIFLNMIKDPRLIIVTILTNIFLL